MQRRRLRNLPVLGGLIALCFAAAALAPATPLALKVGSEDGHTFVRLGLAYVHLAFDFGQECPKSNGCGLLPA